MPLTIKNFNSTTLRVDFLLVGGGGGGGGSRNVSLSGGGGGAGGFIECLGYRIPKGEYGVIIGTGGQAGREDWYAGCNGGNSCFDSLVAYGGGGGGTSGCNMCNGCGGGSGGGGAGGFQICGTGGVGCSGQGNSGGQGDQNGYTSGGGGGAGGVGCKGANSSSPGCGGDGGIGLYSNMNGECCMYSRGGGGGGYCTRAHGQPSNGNAIFYGWGGGGGQMCYFNSYLGCNGCQGVFILRYPSSCGYNINGGTKYECNGYCIHCFTSSGDLDIN